MKPNLYRKVLLLYIALVITAIFLNLLVYWLFVSFEPAGLKLDAKDFTSGEDDLSYYILDHEDETRITFSATITRQDLDIAGDGEYAVLFYQLNGQAYRALFNGDFIGSVGDIETGNSNVWNSVNYFYFDSNKIKDENILSIDLVCLYDRGLTAMPVYILKASELNHFIGYAKYSTEGFNQIALGVSIFSCIVVFILYLISSPRNSAFLFFSLALLFLGLFTFNYATIYNLPFSCLVYKKLMLGALYMAVSMASLGIYKLFHRRADLFMSLITILGYFIIFIIIVRDIITLKLFYSYFNFIIILNIISWVITSQKSFKKKDEAKLFLIGNISLLLCTLTDIILIISGQSFSLSTPFTYSIVLSTAAIILFFREFANKNLQLKQVNDAHRESYLASITDSLTGLYNHRYLSDVLKNTLPPYSVAMIDIDNFKLINDSFGHRFGDAMIRFVAHSLTNQVRSTDVLFRYGGDEFFIIFPKCTAEKAKGIIQKIQTNINENMLNHNEQIVSLTFSGGVYYVSQPEDVDSIIDKADDLLYVSKKEGKNRITIFHVSNTK